MHSPEMKSQVDKHLRVFGHEDAPGPWPWTIGQLDGVVFDVDKTRLLKVLSAKVSCVGVGTESAESFDEQVAESYERPVVRNAVVVGMDLAIEVLQLHPRSGLHMPVRPVFTCKRF